MQIDLIFQICVALFSTWVYFYYGIPLAFHAFEEPQNETTCSCVSVNVSEFWSNFLVSRKTEVENPYFYCMTNIYLFLSLFILVAMTWIAVLSRRDVLKERQE